MTSDLHGLQQMFANFGEDMVRTAPLYARLARSAAQDREIAGLLLANDTPICGSVPCCSRLCTTRSCST
ncbi:hypothetical protein [Ornithinimicrobium sp. INDO-MA30-4]|uniref:hypothetical protein n=1 Tax=Ornithinimicrobium sp. INDO-MA30-4 TaxID=2908651 RepID=UPI001F439167|nr:hypothetical protein [Ornithinimicrobium sp. INDO-MA30-4]UJH70391.1 hypothetical protein L0A91_14880 [Ornithinimicrobium sp. INDO-MA30-4]